MYLERVKAKGKHYLYLRIYSIRLNYSSNKETIFKFGRVDKALENMYLWRSNFNELPEPLRKRGCTRKDLEDWIAYIERFLKKVNKLNSAV